MSPHETFFLTPTTHVDYHEVNNNPYIKFNIKDFPGNQEFKENNAADFQTISQCGALIYVIDAQSGDYENACARLRDIIKATNKCKQKIAYEVFIHKVDSDMFMTDD